MKWSVIIPMGRPERAGITLRSLANQVFFPPSWEILLVGVKAQVVATRYAELPIVAISLEKNELPPKTRLIGSNRATGNWLIFVDDDMELASDYFERLYAIINSENIKGEKIPDAIGARLPGVINNFSDRLTNISNFWSQQSSRSGSRPWLYSAAIAIRTEAYNNVGGFNPHLPNGEDIDLTQKLVQANYRLHYDPTLVAFHNHGRTTPAKMLAYFWKNGNTAIFFNQNSMVTRCFSIKTIIHHVFKDLHNNIKMNTSHIPHFTRYLPFIFINYLVFQISIEWHYQKHLWQSSNFQNLPFPHSGDQKTFQAFNHFKANCPIQGTLLYIWGLLKDLFHPIRR